MATMNQSKRVEVSTAAYRRSHGAEPRGRGGWMFVMGKEDYDYLDEVDAQGRKVVWSVPHGMSFGEAKKAAVAEARRRGISLVGVCS